MSDIKGKIVYFVLPFLCILGIGMGTQKCLAQGDIDQTAPTILQVSPLNAQENVPAGDVILVDFSEPMDTFLTNSAFNMDPSLDGSLLWNQEQTSLSFQPSNPFPYKTTISIAIDTLAADLAGNPLQQAFSWEFTTQSNPWIHYDEIDGKSLSQNRVRAVFGADNGDLWVGIEAYMDGGSSVPGGLYRFDGTQWHSAGQALGNINAISQDNTGKIWVASEPDIDNIGGGLHSFNGQQWSHYTSSNSGLTDNSITCLAIDSQDKVWVGSISTGIYSFNGQTWTNYTVTNSGISDNWITAIFANEGIWIGTSFGGIDHFNPSNNLWTSFASDINGQLGLPLFTTNAFSLCNNRLWAGTNIGLLSCNQATGQWSLFDQENGYLPDDYISALVCDENSGDLWIGTWGGTVVYDGFNWNSIPLETSSVIFNMASDAYGDIWMGTENDLSRYDTSSPVLESYEPVNNKTNVSRSSTIVLKFSEPMNPQSVITALSASPAVNFSASWNSQHTQLTLTPSAKLNDNTTYQISLGEEATDIFGHSLGTDYVWKFTTQKETKTTPTIPGYSTIRPISGFPSSFSPFSSYQSPFTSGLSGFTSGLSSFGFKPTFSSLSPSFSFNTFRLTGLTGTGFSTLSANFGLSNFRNTGLSFSLPNLSIYQNLNFNRKGLYGF